MSERVRAEDGDAKATKTRTGRPPARAATKELSSPAADPTALQRRVALTLQRDPPTAVMSEPRQADDATQSTTTSTDGGMSTMSEPAASQPAGATSSQPPAAQQPNASYPPAQDTRAATSSTETPAETGGAAPNASMPAPNASEMPAETDGGTANASTPASNSSQMPAGTGEAAPNASMPAPNSSQMPAGAGGTPNASMPAPNSSQMPAGAGGSSSSSGRRSTAGDSSGRGRSGGGPTGGASRSGSEGGARPPATQEAGPLSGFDLVDHELAEHQQWGAARAAVGDSRSAQRAEFIAQQVTEGMGSGLASGAAAGFVVTLANSGAARLLARRIPVPVIGSIIGGVIGAAGLVSTFASADNRAQLAQTVTRFGEGSSGYEVMANSIDSVVAILDVAANVIDTIGLVCGIIAAGCWLAAGPTLGATSPAAATATSIATACGLASTVISLVKLGLQPLSLLFRSMHTYTSQADPREVQTHGAALSNAAKGLGGTLGGYAGSAAGRGVSNAAGRRFPRQPPARPPAQTRPSQHPEGVQVRAERPAFDAPAGGGRRADGPDGPGPRGDADGPGARTEADAPPMTEAQQRAAARARRQEQAEDVNTRRQEDIQQRAAQDAADAHQARLDTEAQIRTRLDRRQASNQARYEREMNRIDAAEATAVNRATANGDPDGATYARQSASQARDRAQQELRSRNQAAEARAERDFQRVEQRSEAAIADIERSAQVRAGDAEYRPDIAFGKNDRRTRAYEWGNEGMERRGLWGRGPSREQMDQAMDGAQAGDITAGIFAPEEAGAARPGQGDSRYTADNQPTVGVQGETGLMQTAADRADAFVERVNPAYPPPPEALPEDLAQQRALIAQLRETAGMARGEAAEERANEAETRRRSERIGEIRRLNSSAREARSQHQQRTAETAAAVEGQRERSRESGTGLAQASSRLASVGTLITLLGGWRATTAGVAWLLEGVGATDTAASCRQSSRDAASFIGHLRFIRENVSQAQAAQPGQQQGIESNLETARQVSAEGQETDADISSMETGTQCIETDNAQDQSAAAQNASSATADANRSEGEADRQQDEHDRLAADLQDWAERHRAARRAAVAATSQRMESFGYRVIDRTEW